MDLYPSAFVQPEINLPEDQGSLSTSSLGHADSVEGDRSHRKDGSPEPSGRGSLGSLRLSSLATSSVSSFSSVASYHTPPWEVSLAEFTPTATNNAVSYDRDAPTQKLVAVIGREFDTPVAVADKLQKQYRASGEMLGEGVPRVKFLGYQVRRKELLNTKFKMEDLQKHDSILFCYNASEARILLTGTDGYYSNLLRQVERTLGICTHACTNHSALNSTKHFASTKKVLHHCALVLHNMW